MSTSILEELENLPDITLLKDEGITLERIQEEMIADYQYAYSKATGEDVVLHPAHPKRLEMNAFSGQQYQAYVFGEYMFKQNFLKFMEESVLKNWGGNLGFSESNQRAATVVIEFGVTDVLEFDVTIPAGTRVTAGDNVFFASDKEVIIKAGELCVGVTATCTENGTKGNDYVIGQLNTIADPVPYLSYAKNTSVSGGGKDEYTVDELREKIFRFPSTYSVAGPEDAYVYWVKSYSTDIVSVKVITDESACVTIYVMLSGGNLPSDEYCQGVKDYLKNLKRFPDTDKISILPPEVIDYELNATYYVSMANKSNEEKICKSVQNAAAAYVQFQYESLGVDINPDTLVEFVRVAGAKRVDISTPAYQKLSDSQVAICSAINLIYGGMEEN